MINEKNIFSHVLKILKKLKIPYMIGGSVASIAYGEPRLTLDMDVVILLNQDQAKKLSVWDILQKLLTNKAYDRRK